MYQNPKKAPWEEETGVEKKKRIILPDPSGMYTGRPVERYEVPVQDGDDL